MNKVRLGIIGMGNIGKHHADYLLAGKVSRCELAAISDVFPQSLERYKGKGPKAFTEGEELIRSGEVDAVVVATPHYQHTTLGIAALKAGLHAMIEKPISAHKADAERLIATARQYPSRFSRDVQPGLSLATKIRKLIQAGQLGEIVRIN